MALKSDLLRRVMPALLTAQESAHAMRRDIERYNEREAECDTEPAAALKYSESIEEARHSLSSSLTHYFNVLAIALEAVGLAEASRALRTRWRVFQETDLGSTIWNGEREYTDSPPIRVLDASLDGLRHLAVDRPEQLELDRLERLLWATATIVRDEGAPAPTKEGDVERVMHKYLRVLYDANFVDKPNISGAVQNFEPDCGLRHLKVAIEWKFADDKTEAKGMARGILEDTAGYSGSHDWTRFYAVIYQTDAWLTEHRYREEVRRVGADTWKVIAVTGTGRREDKSERKRKEKKGKAAEGPTGSNGQGGKSEV